MKHTATVVVHLCLGSQLGVLTRIYLSQLFQNGCSGHWGVCLTSPGTSSTHYSAYFTDLPANLLGCFVMGLLVAATALSHSSGKPLLLLWGTHPWQTCDGLHLGLRTGYCGSLTTFSSWQLQMVTMIIGGPGAVGGQWGEALWGWTLGLQLALASLAFGQQCALLVHHHISQMFGTEGETDEWVTPSMEVGFGPSQEAQQPDPESNRAPVPPQQMHHPEEPLDEHGNMHMMSDPGLQRAVQASMPGLTPELGSMLTLRSSTPLGNTDSSLEPKQDDGQDSSSSESNSRARNASQVGNGVTDGVVKERLQLRKTDAAALVALACLTALWIVLAVVDSEVQHASRRGHWFALLFGPPGCLLRWRLAQLNNALPGRWGWLPLGTFIANMLACAVDYIIKAVLVRTGTQSYWAQLLTSAVITGFAGSLSTVSTWAMEIQAHLKAVPESIHGYVYAIGTIITGALLGVILYGWSMWA